jgi:peptide/nickel transport system permease protein
MRYPRTLPNLPRSAWVGAAVLGLLGLMAIFAPWVTPYDPAEPFFDRALEGPSADFWFGTDELGRDLFSRVVFGARSSLSTGLGAVLIAMSIGVPLGLIGGFYSGWRDVLINRFIDVLLAVPSIMIALGIIAVVGRGRISAMVAVAVVSIPAFARVTRSRVLPLKEEEFVAATVAMGASTKYLLTKTILPNARSPIFVQMVVTGATAILLEASLSFLGLGVPPPEPSWGELLRTGKNFVGTAPWYSVLPGIFLTATVLSLDGVGRGLQAGIGSGGGKSAGTRGGP